MQEREAEIRDLTKQGIIPFVKDLQEENAMPSEFFPALMGQAAGAITEVKTAAEIVESVMVEALEALNQTIQLRSNL